MRQVAASADPDCAQRMVTLPASWDDTAANAIAALVPGDGPVNLPVAAQAWIGPIAAGDAALDAALHQLLISRRATANPVIWQNAPGVPGFVLNLRAFFSPDTGFDITGFADAARVAAHATKKWDGAGQNREIGFSGLDDVLASLGLAYDQPCARATAACLAALFRAAVDRGLDGDQLDLLAAAANWPWPPGDCAISGLAQAASAARSALLRAPDAALGAGIFAPTAADALLGVETGGIAPAYALVLPGSADKPQLTDATRARLASRHITAEAAFAHALLGDRVVEIADLAAHAAMHAAVAPYLSAMPAPPVALPAPPPATAVAAANAARGPLPVRHASTTRKVSVGGHRLFLRAGDYADGSLGEVSLTLPGENALVRGLAESFAQAITTGLQHGVPVAEFVDALALTRFGPAGRVEGDDGVTHAASIVDYVMRSLAAQYLGKTLPPPPADVVDDSAASPGDRAPLLPLDLPKDDSSPPARRRAFRVVA